MLFVLLCFPAQHSAKEWLFVLLMPYRQLQTLQLSSTDLKDDYWMNNIFHLQACDLYLHTIMHFSATP